MIAQHIKSNYPNALEIRSLEQKITSELNLNGFILSRTIWGTSICSDEINNSFNILSRQFVGPGPFHFGGISGIPFTGKTGVAAFASHIPTNGNAFILYGPHIGISKQGTVGEILRQRQNSDSTCCGSIIAGLNSISSGEGFETDPIHDYQQHTVVNMLSKKKKEILAGNNTTMQSTEVAYEYIRDEIKSLVKGATNIPSGTKVFLMGGIVINTDFDKEDWFDIRDTELVEF